ncbi:hypothetical protein SAMN05216516_108131 [Izhakiella capsodis]|uniref:Bacteriophage protein n=1 Tax=Izhakiella capsodis TaxID=1367852 RepID=A0A1I4ZDZ0_9GAMM|nr:hypothetical protein [Izhakiella capsodis]SFN48494.1 hypothetical protein SAMN05216516_108131 [Izhakiella capsodis]
MKSGVSIRVDRAKSVLDALKTIGNRDVLVGIPAETSARNDASIGNAAIGYINENGSPARNIPARPHLQPGVKSVQDKTLPMLKQAALLTLDKNMSGAERMLNQAGATAADGVKRFITASDFVPLAESTLAARARRGGKGALAELESRAAGNAPDNSNARPLIDTGQYRRAITYIVRDKNAKS